jgi:hypothetical protein
MLRIPGNAVELDLPNDMTIYDTVNVSRLKVYCRDDSRVAWRPSPPQKCSSGTGTSHIIE